MSACDMIWRGTWCLLILFSNKNIQCEYISVSSLNCCSVNDTTSVHHKNNAYFFLCFLFFILISPANIHVFWLSLQIQPATLSTSYIIIIAIILILHSSFEENSFIFFPRTCMWTRRYSHALAHTHTLECNIILCSIPRKKPYILP